MVSSNDLRRLVEAFADASSNDAVSKLIDEVFSLGYEDGLEQGYAEGFVDGKVAHRHEAAE